MMALGGIWAFIKELPWKYICIALGAISLALLIYRAPWAESRQKAKDYAHFQPILARDLQNITTLKSNQTVLQREKDEMGASIIQTAKDANQRVDESSANLANVQKKNLTLEDANKALAKDMAKRPSANDPCNTREALKGAQI